MWIGDIINTVFNKHFRTEWDHTNVLSKDFKARFIMWFSNMLRYYMRRLKNKWWINMQLVIIVSHGDPYTWVLHSFDCSANIWYYFQLSPWIINTGGLEKIPIRRRGGVWFILRSKESCICLYIHNIRFSWLNRMYSIVL